MWTLEQIQDGLYSALSADLERGVKWMNEEAWEQWIRAYPTLNKVIQDILELDLEEDYETKT